MTASNGKTPSSPASLLLAVVICVSISSRAESQKIYWTDFRLESLNRANLDGSGIEALRVQHVQRPADIAIDPVGGKLYWAESYQKRPSISRCNLDGTNVEHFIRGVSFDLTGLALDVVSNKVYWSQLAHTGVAPGLLGEIFRADLSGANIETLLAEEAILPFGIALDAAAGNLYFADQAIDSVKRCNVDACNPQTLVPNTDTLDIALDLTNQNMFWFDFTSDRMQRSGLDGSKITPLTAFPASTVTEVDEIAEKVYVAVEAEAKIQSTDLNGDNLADVIVQPEGQLLRRLALDRGEGKLYWHNPAMYGFQRGSVDGSNVELVIGGVRLRSPSRIVLHPSAGQMLWSDRFHNSFERSATNGSNHQAILNEGFQWRSWELDPGTEKVYGIRFGVIQRMNLDGSEVETLIDTDIVNPQTMALDLARQKIYWWDLRSRLESQFRRADLDGRNIETVHTTTATFVRSLSVAAGSGFVFWIESSVIHRSDLEFDNIMTFDLNVPSPTSLAVDSVNEKLYFTNASFELFRCGFDGTQLEPIIDDPDLQPSTITVDPCGIDDGIRLADHARLVDCLGQAGDYVFGSCHCADFSGNLRIDLRDFAIVQRFIRAD